MAAVAPTVAPDQWVLCDSDDSFTAPKLGPAWTKVGTPTYSVAKFGNGQDCKDLNNWYTTFDQTKASISFIFKAGYNYNDNINHDILYDRQLGGYFAVTKTSTNKIEVIIWNYPTGTTYAYYIFNLDTGFTSGDNIGILITFDNSASADKIKLYIDGVPQSVSAIIADGSFAGSGLNVNLGGYANPLGVIDNVMIWVGTVLTPQNAEWLATHESWQGTAARRRILRPIIN
jgi:hypothetical protein